MQSTTVSVWLVCNFDPILNLWNSLNLQLAFDPAHACPVSWWASHFRRAIL